MVISELIKHLEGIQQKHGDLDCGHHTIYSDMEGLELQDIEHVIVETEKLLASGVVAYNDDGNEENPTHVWFHT